MWVVDLEKLKKILKNWGENFPQPKAGKFFFSVSFKFFTKLFKIYHPHQKSNFEQKALFLSADVWMETLKSWGKNLPQPKARKNFFSVFSRCSCFFSSFSRSTTPTKNPIFLICRCVDGEFGKLSISRYCCDPPTHQNYVAFSVVWSLHQLGKFLAFVNSCVAGS